MDTATAAASIAVYDQQRHRLLAENTWLARRRHTQDLIAAVQNLLQQANACISDIDALAVTTGPGSFTGVRIGISAVKGIGLGLRAAPSVVGIPTVAVTAAPWIAMMHANSDSTSCCAYIQAGRGRYNWAWFEAGDLLRRPGVEDHGAGTAEEFTVTLAAQTRTVLLVGELDEALKNAVSALPHVTAVNAANGLRRAGNLAHLASLHLGAGEEDSIESLQPLYLRNP